MDPSSRTMFEAIYKKYYNQLVAHAYRYLHDWPLSNEAAQEAFLVTWRRFDTFQASENKIGWLKVTTKNIALNMVTKMIREKQLFISICEASDNVATNSMEIPLSVDLMFQNIITDEEIYLLKRIVLDKATYLDLSKELNISVWACQKRMQRLLKKLQSFLKDNL